MSIIDQNILIEEKILKKRGRKPKNHNEKTIEVITEPVIQELKKRGRKPTCKIMNNSDFYNYKKEVTDDALLVHFPLTKLDIEKMSLNESYDNMDEYIETPQQLIIRDKKLDLELDKSVYIEKEASIKYNLIDKCNNCENLSLKINTLESKYHIYKITNTDREIYNINLKLEDTYTNIDLWDNIKDVACWWCCHTFDTLPIGLPEKYYEKKFQVLGSFCSFNCAMAYDLSLNDHKMWDRISLLYHLRNKIFLNIYPNNDIKILDDIIMAPPRCMLKMFGGKLDINEFREKSIILKKQYRNIIPPTITLTQQIEETTYNQDQNILLKQNKVKNLSNITSGLVLKRSKPIASKTSLYKMMNIQEV